MRSRRSGRAWAWRALGLIAVGLLAGNFAILAAAQQNNRVAEGEAAAVGQPVPGPTSRPRLPGVDSNGQPATQISAPSRQQLELRKLRFEKMKEDARQLAEMARTLDEAIEKSNPDILSTTVTEQARKIQKLAGKIRSESRY